MRRIIGTALLLLLCAGAARAQAAFTRQQFEEDFDHLWQNVADDYAYFDQKQTDWGRVREIYRPRVAAVKTQGDFVALLETVLEELYDFHAHLGTNTASSPRLVPSGADIWAEWAGGRAVVTEVRAGSAAERAGVRAGMQVVAVNGTPVDEAVRARVGKSLRAADPAARNWALGALLAGRRNEERRVELTGGGERVTVVIDDRPTGPPGATPLLEFRRIGSGVGYVRINNSLGNFGLVREFDAALAALRATRGLILDLRDTPSGGNTTVARAVMGRFISRELPYQKHSIPSEERLYGARRSWLELVSPRGEFTYRAPVVVLVNRWTGSMGEGLAIGLDGMKRATVVGTEMARLVGATSSVRLPHTGIGVTFPTEKLFHVNGTPREQFVPRVRVDLLSGRSRPADDAILRAGLRTLRRLIEHDSRPLPE